MSGLSLSAGDIEALGQRTEGWVAALQLAALSLQGREDPSAFISRFAGNDKYVVDYLVDEVLAQQDSDVREFLLCTSVLDRLSGSLCDAVTGARGRAVDAGEPGASQHVPLPAWTTSARGTATTICSSTSCACACFRNAATRRRSSTRNASRWYEDNGDVEDSVTHALDAG